MQDMKWGQHPGFDYRFVTEKKDLQSLGFESSDFAATTNGKYNAQAIFSERFGKSLVNMNIWYDAVKDPHIKQKAEEYLKNIKALGLPPMITSTVQLYAEKESLSKKHLVDKEVKDIFLVSKEELDYLCDMSYLGLYNNLKNIERYPGIEVKLNGYTTRMLGRDYFRFNDLVAHAQSMKRKSTFFNVINSIDKDYFRSINKRNLAQKGTVDPYMVYLALPYSVPGIKSDRELAEENERLTERVIELLRSEKKAVADWHALQKKYALLKAAELRRRPRPISVPEESIDRPYPDEKIPGLDKVFKDER
jgi:hypothetical protein